MYSAMIDTALPCTAFAGDRQLAHGSLIDVALAVKAAGDDAERRRILVFDDTSGRVVDLDLRGTADEIAARLTASRSSEADDPPARTRGRPKLGVVAREVTLLPRHWQWLAAQPGGASQALRRLVDDARRGDDGQARRKAARETCYRFLSALAGDLPGFEEVIRALFAGDDAGFVERMAEWPSDIARHAARLAGLSSSTHPHESA